LTDWILAVFVCTRARANVVPDARSRENQNRKLDRLDRAKGSSSELTARNGPLIRCLSFNDSDYYRTVKIHRTVISLEMESQLWDSDKRFQRYGIFERTLNNHARSIGWPLTVLRANRISPSVEWLETRRADLIKHLC